MSDDKSESVLRNPYFIICICIESDVYFIILDVEVFMKEILRWNTEEYCFKIMVKIPENSLYFLSAFGVVFFRIKRPILRLYYNQIIAVHCYYYYLLLID